MKYLTIFAVVLLVTAIAVSGASAQVYSTMPVLYNTNGTAVNSSGMAAPSAGWYYLQPGNGSSQVYYYGNGTFYNPTTGLYGGSVSNPYGTAGVTLNYVPATVTYTTPGVPNTGMGGDATTIWAMLLAAGVVAVAGVYYMNRRVTIQ